MSHATAEAIQGDCLDAMRTIAETTRRFDAIVTDPPYGLKFMGKRWDRAVPGVEYWTAALEVAKPGAWLVAFGGTRTFHRVAVAIEDAGWELRDTLCWLYSQGFPKSLNVEKAIDEETAGAHNPAFPTKDGAPFAGYGTGLKPAREPIILARAPLDGTVAHNALKHGTGALNITACSIGDGERVNAPHGAHVNSLRPYDGKGGPGRKVRGRWPANIALDEGAAELLDRQVGPLESGKPCGVRSGSPSIAMKNFAGKIPVTGYGDAGGASRFYYVPKASPAERERGLASFDPDDVPGRTHSDDGRPLPFKSERERKNTHPTVKPVALMRWLVRLVTGPRDCVVFDPFMGTGTTGEAAIEEGCSFVGCESDPATWAIARAKLRAALHRAPRLF